MTSLDIAIFTKKMPGEYFFARIYDPFVDPYIRKIRHKVLELARNYQPEHILDVCCGTGHQLKLLRKYGFNVTGLDLSDNMLNISRKGKHSPNCIKADATAMPFENGSFDMVMITLALHENTSESAKKIIKEMTRVAKPNGSVILVDYESSSRTRKDARVITRTIEWLAGGDHYRNYKKYIQNNGLEYLLKNMPLSLKEEYRFAGNSLVIKVLGRT
jgi:demethylmenaquinone methyltransferase/2-methoxy-6-polyprenyl-1,4-benzoquinol methylase